MDNSVVILVLTGNQINIVVEGALDGGRMRGASTIPMQSVKNLYLWSDRSYLRKVLEVPLALMIDLVWGKKRVMEIYLNIAEWGPGIYGIEAASRHHFKRSARSLSAKQAALLAVTLPNPKLRNPRKPNRHMRLLARLVERRSRASGSLYRVSSLGLLSCVVVGCLFPEFGYINPQFRPF